jgi:carbonic anhydrase
VVCVGIVYRLGSKRSFTECRAFAKVKGNGARRAYSSESHAGRETPGLTGTREASMTRIIQGVLNFQRRIFGGKRELFSRLGKGQKPLALFITCSDSRIAPDLLAQTEPGELFVLRNAGNLVPPHAAGPVGAEAATIEYAVAQLRVRDVILCGHSKCGAMHGLLEPESLSKLPSVAGWLDHARAILPEVTSAGAGLKPEDQLKLAIEKNVLLQLEHVKTHPAVVAALGARSLRLHGWVYHFEKGLVDVYDPVTGKFGPLDQHVRERMLENAGKDEGPRSDLDTYI